MYIKSCKKLYQGLFWENHDSSLFAPFSFFGQGGVGESLEEIQSYKFYGDLGGGGGNSWVLYEHHAALSELIPFLVILLACVRDINLGDGDTLA